MDFWIKHDLKTNTSPDRTRNLARCRSFQTLVNFPKLTKKYRKQSHKRQSTPPIFRMSGGVLLMKKMTFKRRGAALPHLYF